MVKPRGASVKPSRASLVYRYKTDMPVWLVNEPSSSPGLSRAQMSCRARAAQKQRLHP